MKWLRTILSRMIFLGLLWIVLAGLRFEEPVLIVLILTAALASSLWLLPPGRTSLRLVPLIRFVPYFLTQSILGGWDVARRAYAPSMPIEPAFVEIRLRLEDEWAVRSFAWSVSLLPGTASVRLTGDRMLVHVLDASGPNEARLVELQKRIGAVFGESMSDR